MDRPVETFSVGIKGDPSNELQHARKIARHFGANYHEIIIDEKDFIDFLPEMAYLQDEPLADGKPKSGAIFFCCKERFKDPASDLG